MFKKKIIASVLVCALLILSVIPAYGAIVNEEVVEPMALYYSTVSASLSISSSGIATAKGAIKGIPGTTTKTTVHLYLQQYKNGEWVDVDDWLETGEAVSRTLTKTKTVTKGYTYRAKASCYAYSGSKYEHVTKYSIEVKY